MQPNGKPNNEKYAAHILECAEIASRVGAVLGLREDAARQACFATVCIDAKGHGVFLEPIPKDSKTPVAQPKLESNAIKKDVDMTPEEKDRQAAERADAQIDGVPKATTPEQDAGVRRSTLLEGIESAKTLLNKAGFTPPVTPKGLLAIINEELKIPGNLGTMDNDDLEKIIMHLSKKLDNFRSNLKALEAEAPF